MIGRRSKDSSDGLTHNMAISMGQLKPNANYIYERDGNNIYAREMGTTDRLLIGYDSRTDDGRPLIDHIKEDQLWNDIRRAAKTNPSLQSELERVIMLYHLTKEQKDTIFWHPV